MTDVDASNDEPEEPSVPAAKPPPVPVKGRQAHIVDVELR